MNNNCRPPRATIRYYPIGSTDQRGARRAAKSTRLRGTIDCDMTPTMALRYNHEKELRTIGQQLDKLAIDIFELHHNDGDYSLQCADPNPPYLDLIKLRYSAYEVRSLDLQAAEARTEQFTLVDFQSLAETLRAIGRYLEKHEAKLLRISVLDSLPDCSIWRLEYEARDGRYRSEEKPRTDLADLAMHMYKERGRIKDGFQERGSAR